MTLERDRDKSCKKRSKKRRQIPYDETATGKEVARWAKKKYGKDALYMLEDTHEGHEIFGEKATDAAVKLLKDKSKKSKIRRK